MRDMWLEKFKTEAVPKLKEYFHPQEIILFGSRVRGIADEQADIDVIVIADMFATIPFVKRMALVLK